MPIARISSSDHMKELHISMVAYFLTSVGGVLREVVAPAGHGAREHQNFQGMRQDQVTKACDAMIDDTTDTRQTYKLRE